MNECKESIQKKLPSICSAPWKQIHTVPSGAVKTCCFSDTVLAKTQNDTLPEAWNSDTLKRIRKEFLQGDKPADCHKCWKAEDRGGWSLRQKMNEVYPLSENDLEATDGYGHFTDYKPQYLDIRFSNLCSFRCRSCGLDYSSSWYEDTKKLHPDKEQEFVQFFPDQSTRTKLLSEVKEILPHVAEIYFAGGEPLFNPEHYEILEELIRLGRTDVRLTYNTNLSIIKYGNYDLFKLWKEFKNVSITASIDAPGARGELIRKGSNWERTKSHLHQIRESFPHFKVSVCCTVSLLNVHLIPSLYQELVENLKLVGLNSFFLNLVQNPAHLAVNALPRDYRLGVLDAIKDFKSQTIAIKDKSDPGFDHILDEGLVAVIKALNEPWEERAYWKFLLWNKKIDAIREENFWEVFPEMLAIHPVYNEQVRCTERWQTVKNPYKYISDSICIQPFVHFCSSNQGRVQACCMAHEESKREDGVPHRVGRETISEIWHASHLADLRKDLLIGKRPKTCQSCWNEEDAGKFSKRMNDNLRLRKHLDRIKENPEFPAYFEMKIGTLCNIRCRICSSTNSVKWLKEEVHFNNLRSNEPIVEDTASGKRLFKPNLGGLQYENIQQELEANLGSIELLDFTGGEPFLSMEHWDLLRKCVEQGHAHHIAVHYNTNGTIYPKIDQIALWKHFRHVDIMVSVDGIGKRFELQRNPAKWDVVQSNIEKLRALPHFVHICHSISALNLFYLPEFIDWIEEKQIHYYLNLVHEPKYMNVKLLPIVVKDEISERLNAYVKEHPSFGMGRNISKEIIGLVDFMNSEDFSAYVPKFLKFMSQCDTYRGENWEETFPELCEAIRNSNLVDADQWDAIKESAREAPDPIPNMAKYFENLAKRGTQPHA